jgi:hypothetical protein
MAAKFTRLTHKVAIQLHLVAERCTICSSRSRRPVRKLLDTPSYSPILFDHCRSSTITEYVVQPNWYCLQGGRLSQPALVVMVSNPVWARLYSDCNGDTSVAYPHWHLLSEGMKDQTCREVLSVLHVWERHNQTISNGYQGLFPWGWSWPLTSI